jgi:proteasome accessory factor C
MTPSRQPAGSGSRRSATAEAQLERILYILAAAARHGGAALDELADALGVSPATILRDLEEATARVYHHPAGSTESFSITLERRRVRVRAPAEFQRPVRLNAAETLSLGLGLRALAAEAEPGRRAAILALASRLEAELAVPDTAPVTAPADVRVLYSPVPEVAEPEVEYDAAPVVLAFDDDGFRSVVADAIDVHRICTMWYLKPGGTQPEQRRIAPYRLVYADGTWYVAAHDMDRDDLRFFRMDRVLDAAVTEHAAPPEPAELSALLLTAAPFIAGNDVEVEVRYSPRIARWLQERTPCVAADDGSVVVRHRVADARWLVRHVLQYGGDAVVVEPAEARRWVAQAASRMAAAGRLAVAVEP